MLRGNTRRLVTVAKYLIQSLKYFHLNSMTFPIQQQIWQRISWLVRSPAASTPDRTTISGHSEPSIPLESLEASGIEGSPQTADGLTTEMKTEGEGKTSVAIKGPLRNRVLPSYEVELQEDNSVVRENQGRWLLRRALHSFKTLYHYFANTGTANERPRPLLKVVDRLTRTPHDISKIAVIAVHGWFPGKILQRVVGEPTGTSAYFAKKMANACKTFFADRYGIRLRDECISTIALEGGGKVVERVEMLYKQLVDPSKDWVQKIREADMVLIVAHSQGTPVATILTSKLVEEGIIQSQRQTTAILAMAGISHGINLSHFLSHSLH